MISSGIFILCLVIWFIAIHRAVKPTPPSPARPRTLKEIHALLLDPAADRRELRLGEIIRYFEQTDPGEHWRWESWLGRERVGFIAVNCPDCFNSLARAASRRHVANLLSEREMPRS